MNEYVVTINKRKKEIKILKEGVVLIDGKEVNASFTKINQNSFLLRYNEKVYEVAANQISSNGIRFLVDGWYFDTTVRTKLQETAYELQKNKEKLQHKAEIKAPMPGLIIKIKKNVGDEVVLGEPILVLEAMKMENDLVSPASGTIKKIYINEGQSVEKDSILMYIEQ